MHTSTFHAWIFINVRCVFNLFMRGHLLTWHCINLTIAWHVLHRICCYISGLSRHLLLWGERRSPVEVVLTIQSLRSGFEEGAGARVMVQANGGPIYIYIYIYDPGPRFPAPPPKGRGGLDSLLQLMISVRNPCYGAPPERFPSGGALEELYRSSGDGLLTTSNILLQESLSHIVS